MSRWKAAGIHLGISLIVAALVGALIYFIWYPPPYFTVAGGSNLMLLILGVDVVIGPCLTLAVFRAGKWGLKFDLAVITLLQVGAFCYGLSVISSARPAFVVAVVDRFIPVAANEITDADLAQASNAEYATRSWHGPVLVGAVVSKADTYSLTMSALAGRDVEKRPKYYVAYEQVADTILAHALPLTELAQKKPTQSAQIEHFVAGSGEKAENLVYLPLQSRLASFTMVLSTRTKRPVGALAVDPW